MAAANYRPKELRAFVREMPPVFEVTVLVNPYASKRFEFTLTLDADQIGHMASKAARNRSGRSKLGAVQVKVIAEQATEESL